MAIFCRVAALLTATVGTVVIAAAPADAATAFTVKGTQTDHPAPYPEQLLPKVFANDSVTRIDYPAKILGMDASIAVATAGIVNAVQNAFQEGMAQVVVAGFSQGAVAVAHAKQALMSLPSRPSPANLSFVTIGDPSGPGGILGVLPFRVPVLDLSPITAPDTPYDSVVVNGEYDGWADFPDRLWNVVSLANAVLGIAYVHGRYETVPGGLDISGIPASNITTTINSLGGRTTRYLLPTDHLPLLQPLRDIGIAESIVAAIEKPLRAVVDAGYARNDARSAATAPRPAVAVPALLPAVTPSAPVVPSSAPAVIAVTPPADTAEPAAVVGPPPSSASPEAPPAALPARRSRAAVRAPAAAAAAPAQGTAAPAAGRATKTAPGERHSTRRPAA